MFSVTAFYWGNEDNLKRYVDHAKKYTDDITIGFIDLFGKIPKIDNLNVIEFDHRFLLDNGHASLMNIVDTNCKYDWTFHLAVGKKITWFKDVLLNSPPDNVSGYGSKERGNDKDVWSNFHNKNKAKWIKTVHEAIEPFSGYANSSEPIIEWERIGQDKGYDWAKQYEFDNEEQKIICQRYRQLSRIKWVALEDIDPHPARDRAMGMYKTHRWAYELNREDLLCYLVNNDVECGM